MTEPVIFGVAESDGLARSPGEVEPGRSAKGQLIQNHMSRYIDSTGRWIQRAITLMN